MTSASLLMSEYHRIPLIHRNQIPQPTDAGKGERIDEPLSALAMRWCRRCDLALGGET